jgi:hypothetical protein
MLIGLVVGVLRITSGCCTTVETLTLLSGTAASFLSREAHDEGFVGAGAAGAAVDA